jgi:hypothetical protein
LFKHEKFQVFKFSREKELFNAQEVLSALLLRHRLMILVILRPPLLSFMRQQYEVKSNIKTQINFFLFFQC